jgi:hypothetical protein
VSLVRSISASRITGAGQSGKKLGADIRLKASSPSKEGVLNAKMTQAAPVAAALTA